MEKITLCGDNCLECPRYLAKTNRELEEVAKLWFKIGWTDKIVSTDEIKCSGCASHKQCTYHLVECIKENEVEKCNQCIKFPCHKIDDMLRCSKEYEKRCRDVCTEEEYHKLKLSFFNKEQNLQK